MLKKARIRDRKAPRFRTTKYRHDCLNKDIFKQYKDAFKSEIDWKTFKGVIEDFNDMFSDEVVNNRDGVKLPGHMGFMALCAFKPKYRTPLNWLQIDDTGLQIKDLNLDTNELVCKIVYSNYTAKYKLRHLHVWKFEGCRRFKNKASAAFRINYNKYKRIDLEKTRYPSKIFQDDYIRANFKRPWNEQRSECGLEDNGQTNIQ